MRASRGARSSGDLVVATRGVGSSIQLLNGAKVFTLLLDAAFLYLKIASLRCLTVPVLNLLGYISILRSGHLRCQIVLAILLLDLLRAWVELTRPVSVRPRRNWHVLVQTWHLRWLKTILACVRKTLILHHRPLLKLRANVVFTLRIRLRWNLVLDGSWWGVSLGNLLIERFIAWTHCFLHDESSWIAPVSFLS